MIIVDISGIMVACVHALVGMNDKFEEAPYKALVLSSINSYKKKFSKDYGKLVFAMDTKPYWRLEKHPHYKYKRAIQRKIQQNKKSHIDWDESFRVMGILLDDLQTVFPYKVIRVPKCEADDIVGVLCKEFREPIMIISRDHDFKQLQQYPNVKQYDPISKKLIVEKKPLNYLKEHIIRGDAGDGICNILSPADSFFTGTKQSSVSAKKVTEWMDQDIIDFAETSIILERFKQNEKLIDLSKVPDEYQEVILEEYNKPNEGHNRKIQGYLMKNRLANLLPDLQYFLEKDVVSRTPSLADLM